MTMMLIGLWGTLLFSTRGMYLSKISFSFVPVGVWPARWMSLHMFEAQFSGYALTDRVDLLERAEDRAAVLQSKEICNRSASDNRTDKLAFKPGLSRESFKK